MFANIVAKVAPYGKFVAAVGGVVVIVGEAVSDGAVSQGEGLTIASAIAAAYAVYKVRNRLPA